MSATSERIYRANCYTCGDRILIPQSEWQKSPLHYCYHCGNSNNIHTPMKPDQHPEATATEEPTFGILQACFDEARAEIDRLRDAITTISEINERPTNDRYIEIANACTRALGDNL